MNYKLDSEFINICKSIIAENYTVDDWAEHEADDWFQTAKYCGGFDATEMEFTFSVWIDGEEYWFQISLDDVSLVLSGELMDTEIRLAE